MHDLLVEQEQCRMPEDLRHQLKGAHAIAAVAEELCSMIHALHARTAIPDLCDLCAVTIWPFTDMRPNAAAIQMEGQRYTQHRNI